MDQRPCSTSSEATVCGPEHKQGTVRCPAWPWRVTTPGPSIRVGMRAGCAWSEGVWLARRPATDERQEDIFRTPVPAPRPAKPAPAPTPAPMAAAPPIPAPEMPRHSEPLPELPPLRRLDPRRLSRMELEELVREMPDDVLVQLTGAVARQLRRRITRAAGHGRRSGKGRATALERVAQQLADELSGLDVEEYD
jgi:hypothetical protein